MGNLMKNGVSYTGSMLGGSTKTFKGVLEAGETSISFVDTLITGNSTIDYETSKLGVNPTNIEVANNAVTLTFAAQAEDIGIRVTISNDAAEPAPTKMRFLKATGQQYIKLPFTTNESLTFNFYTANILNRDSQLVFGENNWGMQSYMLQTVNDGFRYMPNGLDISNIGLQTNILHVECTPTYYKVNGKVSSTRTAPIGSSSSNFYFFGNSYGYNLTGSISRIKVYKLGNLVMDLLPTKVGGEACYYDLVGKKAYFSETNTPFELEELEYTSNDDKIPFFVQEYSNQGENRTFTVTTSGTYLLMAGTDGTTLHKPVSITINSSNTPYALGGITINDNANGARYAVIDLNAGDTVNYYNQYGYNKYCVALRLIGDLAFDSVQSVEGVLNSPLTLSPISDYPCLMFMGASTHTSSSIVDNSTIVDPESFGLNATISNNAKWRAIGCYGSGSATLSMSGGSNTAISAISLKLKKKGE